MSGVMGSPAWVLGVSALIVWSGVRITTGLGASGEPELAAMLGVMVPGLALGEWIWLRRRVVGSRDAVDWMAVTIMGLLVCMAVLANGR